MEHASTVDIGARKRRQDGINEDSVATTILQNHHRSTSRPVGIFVLGDGVGGEASGDVASFLATTVVRQRLTTALQGTGTDLTEAFDVDAYPGDPPTVDGDPRRALSEGQIRTAIQESVDAAHRHVQRYAAEIGGRPATTIVVAVYVDGTVYYGWVGDSRLYVVNETDESITQLTEDHAVTNVLLERGEIEDDAHARVHEDATAITRVVGGSSSAKPSVDVEFGTTELYGDDVLLLTSDGLIDAYPHTARLRRAYESAEDTDAVCAEIRETLVTDDEIRDVVLDAPALQTAADDLVALANDRGGKDNISLTLARDPAAEQSPDRIVSRSETVIEPGDESTADQPPSDDADPETAGGATEDADTDGNAATTAVETVSVADDAQRRAAIALPGAGRVIAIREEATLGRPDAADQPDVPLPITDTEVVEGVHAAVTYDPDEDTWRVVDRSTAGTHVEVADGEWLLLLSEEGLAFHREAGFDPDAATERSIRSGATLEDGTAFVLEDPRNDDAVVCRFFSSVERAERGLAEGEIERTRFEQFLT